MRTLVLFVALLCVTAPVTAQAQDNDTAEPDDPPAVPAFGYILSGAAVVLLIGAFIYVARRR